jgi:GH25 family lysozyme M1 (1,4-beta-N-acetylmuramidase)/LysM repeat protein
MTLKGIDVSNYQRGINFETASDNKDFVIVKATEGTTYVSPSCDAQYQQALKLGRQVGVYHYSDGGDPKQEAAFFVSNIKGYIGKAILVLDWEATSNPKYGTAQAVSWCLGWLDEVYRLTGSRPMLYMSAFVTTMHDWSAISKNYALWGAGYIAGATADSPKTDRYRWGAWGYPAIHQYSNSGGKLDLDVGYMTKDGWAKFATGSGTAKANTNIPAKTEQQAAHAPTGSTIGLVARTMQGAYGNGDARKAALGSRYDEVMDVINHIAKSSASTLAAEVWQGKYGNGDLRKTVLGNRYDEVMKVINGKTASAKPAAVYYTVRSGDTLSAIAIRNRTTVRNIMLLNSGIKNPNYIVAGWKIRVK